MTTMVNIYIISSRIEHLQEAEDGIGDGIGWFGGRWIVTLYFLSIVNFLCRMHQEVWVTTQIFQEVWKLKNI